MKKWIEAIKRKNFKPSQHSRICSDHFTNEDFQIRPGASRPLLRLDATPSVFPSFPPYYQKVKKHRINPLTKIPRPVNNDTTPVIDGIKTVLNFIIIFFFLLGINNFFR